jgi:hypothetical protein
MSQALRSVLVLLVGVAVVAICADRVVQSPGSHIPRDYLEYWASARLNLRGLNPYDPVLLLAEQQRAEPERAQPLMMWNPPPALAVYSLFAPFPPRWSALLWVAVQLLTLMIACDLLWRMYAPGQPRWPAQLVAFSFVGTWWVVAYGQNADLLLFGLAGFLHYTRKDRPVAAGACAALTALKPHLLAGFGVLLIADLVLRRGRATLAAGLGVITLALVIVLAMNPNVITHYLAALRDPGPEAVPLRAWALPVPSYWIRITLAPQAFWVQFVPSVLACVALLAWRIRAGERWDWSRALPVIVAVSMLTTPYGGWIFDLPVLLVPVIASAARLGTLSLLFVLFLGGQIAITFFSFAKPGGLHEYWWVMPAVLALCLLGVRKMPVAK